MSYIIIEVANTHGGDIDYINELINTFSSYQHHNKFGMKFQPLHPDKLATKDFEWHKVYQQLYFTPEQWSKILLQTSETKDVWLDLFDEYSVQILKNNIDIVYGIKLQVSVLFNLAVRNELSKIDLNKKKVILNIAALELEEIREFLYEFEKCLNPQEILLEVGFQGYPTELLDSGISKISIIKSTFGKKIVFADHVEGLSEYATWLPVIALASGADVVEKHVMLITRETKYDAYSSIDIKAFDKMVKHIGEYQQLVSAYFVNQRERIYLEGSIMKPILKYPVKKGRVISLERDFDFKRSGKGGLNTRQINNLLKSKHILSVAKDTGDTIEKVDFKKATIAVIIACRLKSTRLKEKALLKIGELPSVSYCIKNACKFEEINHVILATSNLETDSCLANYSYSEGVIFHTGDADDVIQRYLDICRKLNIDIVVRVTADMPFIDNEICQILLNSHFQNGADYTSTKTAAVGTNLEIMNVAALEEIKSHFPQAAYSEYMTWYFTNNQEYFNINLVDLPSDLVRDYRLTLDYEEDLHLFNIIHEHLEKENTNFGIRDIFKFLDEHPDIAKLNSHIKLKYRTDEELIDTLNKATKIEK